LACELLRFAREVAGPPRTVPETILKNLPQKSGLARATHADNRDRFVRDSGDVNVAPRKVSISEKVVLKNQS